MWIACCGQRHGLAKSASNFASIPDDIGPTLVEESKAQHALDMLCTRLSRQQARYQALTDWHSKVLRDGGSDGGVEELVKTVGQGLETAKARCEYLIRQRETQRLLCGKMINQSNSLEEILSQLEIHAAAIEQPSAPPRYEATEYWESRYQVHQEPYDWLHDYTTLRNIVERVANDDCRILNVGCGNSLLPEEMYDDGYINIVNVDISPTVVDHMRSRNQETRPEMQWLEMDATRMPTFADGSFDLILDKGTLDAFACGKNKAQQMSTYLVEVLRVLRSGGVLLCISFGLPTDRLVYLNAPELDLNVSYEELPSKPGQLPVFAYTCRKA